MNHYVVTGKVFEIPAYARVELSPEQYACRRHAVKPVVTLPEKWDKSIFETLQPVQFKQGEQVGTTIDVGKSQMVEVIPVKIGEDPAKVAEAVKNDAKKPDAKKGR